MTINGNIIELHPADIKVIDAPVETKPVEETVLVSDDSEPIDEPAATESSDSKKEKKHKVLNATPLKLRAELKYQHEVKPHIDKFTHGVKQEFDERVDDVKEVKKEVERTIDYVPKRTKRFFRDVATNIRLMRI